MLIVGLTGSIGMGKTTVAERLRENGIPVCDSDAVVHELYAGSAAAPIEAAFPGTVVDGTVDRARLGSALIKDPSGFKRLEAIVHPLVRAAQRDFLLRAARDGAKFAVLEVPLLFETGGDIRVDVVLVVSAPSDVQRERVLQRPGMSPEKLETILARQLPDTEKRARADYVVDTGCELTETLAQVDTIVAELKTRGGGAFERYWRDEPAN